jgi:endonuclease III
MSSEEILNILEHEFPNAQAELDHRNVFELLIAVILSAQATDVSVNKATPALFKAYPDASTLSKAKVKDVEGYLKTLGLYRNKARFIVDTATMLVEDFESQVPSDRESLMRLPGVGRKTANVVMAVGFDIPAIAVDTHVDRVAKRLGWAKDSDSVLEVEKKIMNKLDPKDWGRAHHLLLLLGRYHSTARNKENIYDTLNRLKEKHGL